eukprot:4643863-Pyramimonas_sp.AAC.1
MVIAAPCGELLAFAKDHASTKVDDINAASLQTWALKEISEDDLGKMKPFLVGTNAVENSLLVMPPHYLVWEITKDPCHGLRLSFLQGLPLDVCEQVKGWGQLCPEGEAKNTAEAVSQSLQPAAAAAAPLSDQS